MASGYPNVRLPRVWSRDDLERRERRMLAPYAMCSADSRGRLFADEEEPYRTAFQRDRDRIIHAKAFRRLARKTQVRPQPAPDHVRTRLTHTLEVAQIGRTIARILGCNEDLTEAVCLVHDLGHPPFGHAGEETLDALMRQAGGFNHQRHTFRIVAELEERRPQQPGLNLTYEVRESILKHNPHFAVSDAAGFRPEERATLEAQISNLADEIAYISSDFDDYLRSRLRNSSPDPGTRWPELELLRTAMAALGAAAPTEADFADSTARRQLISAIVTLAVDDCVRTTARNLKDNGIASLAEVRQHPANLADHSAAYQRMNREFKAYLFACFYRHPDIASRVEPGLRTMKQVFRLLTARPERWPPSLAAQSRAGLPAARVVGEYIAGMTDDFLHETALALGLSA